MSKNVLLLFYSQSGQLDEIIDSFKMPFEEASVTVEKVRIKPVQEFDFPWTADRFFDAMPESVIGIPVLLQPFSLKEQRYDLVIFAYQPWYLSPSIPSTSILLNAAVQNILKDTPVVTIIGARNMWLNAQEKVKKILKNAGAYLVGNIVLVDKNSNIISAITILHWMMSGKKDKYLGIFPKPGVADEDIGNAGVFGKTVSDCLLAGRWDGLQHQLVSHGAVEVKSNLMFIEERAGRLFSIWANFIIKRKNRASWLKVFKYYLLFALFIVAPIVLTLNFIFFRVFFLGVNKRKKQYYLGVG